MDLIKLGKNIKQRRESLQLKQADVAEIGGITIKTLHLIETGKGNPSVATLHKITHVLGLELILQIKRLE